MYPFNEIGDKMIFTDSVLLQVNQDVPVTHRVVVELSMFGGRLMT